MHAFSKSSVDFSSTQRDRRQKFVKPLPNREENYAKMATKLQNLLPPPAAVAAEDESGDPWFEKHADKNASSSALVSAVREPPPYGKRSGWAPRDESVSDLREFICFYDLNRDIGQFMILNRLGFIN